MSLLLLDDALAAEAGGTLLRGIQARVEAGEVIAPEVIHLAQRLAARRDRPPADRDQPRRARCLCGQPDGVHRYLHLAVAASLAGVSTTTLRRRYREGTDSPDRLEVVRERGRVLVACEALTDYLRRREQQ